MQLINIKDRAKFKSSARSFCLDKKTRQPEDCLVPGGDEGDRTPYLLNAIQALSQVSYTPIAKVLTLPKYIITRFLKNQYLIPKNFNCAIINFIRLENSNKK